MHPDAALALVGAFFYIGFILVFIAIVYYIGKRMQRVHTRREPEYKEEMTERHINEEPEDKEERFDVGYKELLTASLVCGIIAAVFAGYFIWGYFRFVLAVAGGGGAAYLLKSSTGIKGKLRIRKAGLAGGLTGVIIGFSFLTKYLFWGHFSLSNLGSTVTFIPILFVLGVLGAVMANEKVLQNQEK